MNRSTLQRIAGIVHAEVAMSGDPEALQLREKVIDDMEGLSRRMAAKAIHSTVHASPNVWRRALEYPYKRQGYEVLGFGYHSTALKNGGQVLKVLRRSVHLDDDGKQRMASDLNRRQEPVIDHLGTYSLPQEFSVDQHPIKDGRAVIASQDLAVGFETLDSHHLPNKGDARGQLSDFCRAAGQLIEANGQVPDIGGACNLGFNGDRQLILVDTIPLSVQTDARSYTKSLDRLKSIQASLSSA